MNEQSVSQAPAATSNAPVGGHGVLLPQDVEALGALVQDIGKRHQFANGETAAFWNLVAVLNAHIAR